MLLNSPQTIENTGFVAGELPLIVSLVLYRPTSVYTSVGYMLRIDCLKAEKYLKITPGSDCALNALAIDEPLEYTRLYLDGNLQMWVDAEDSLDL